MAIPEPFSNSVDFVVAWGRWCQWRTRIALHGTPKGAKPPWTENAHKRFFDKFKRWGVVRSIAAIDHSIDRWEDAYEPAEVQKNGHAVETQKEWGWDL
jgi:hypothetical protein